MFRFANIDYLYLLVLIVPLALLFEWALSRRAAMLTRFGSAEAIRRLAPDASKGKLRLKFWLFAAAYAFMVVALARPQVGSKLREVEREGVEIVVAVDVSNSMLASDFSPNRLERTKYALSRMIEGLKEQYIGVVIFAGDAYVQVPITGDYLTARNFVERISTTQVTRQGTAIGAAIELASSAFTSQSGSSRVIILVTDGENHEDDALAAAERAAAAGVKIYTIGMGTPEGAPIAVGDDFIRDSEGEIVVSKLDEATLQKIAALSDGAYIRATNASIGVEEIVARVEQTEKAKLMANVFEEYDELFYLPLLAALVLLVVEWILLPRRNRVFARINLFGERK